MKNDFKELPNLIEKIAVHNIKKYKPKEISNEELQNLIKRTILLKVDRDEIEKLLNVKADFKYI